MNNEAKLGTIPIGTEGRDAVHVAIVPVRAAERLDSGTPVRLNSNNEAEACPVIDAIGVVDPFRPKGQLNVGRGAWFWLCLYPKTITGLRHVWEHPSLPSSRLTEAMPAEDGDKAASKKWLEDYVRQHCPHSRYGGYSEFLRYVTDERRIFYNGTDCHSLSDVDNAEELFRHLSVVLGRRIDASYFEAFTCSC